MGKVDHVRPVALFAVVVVVVAAGVVFWNVVDRSTSDENHGAVELVRAFFHTVDAGKSENAWAAVTTGARAAGTLDAFRARVESHPAFRDIQGFELAVDEPSPGSARVEGTVSTGQGPFTVIASAEQEGSIWRLAALAVDGTAVLP